MRSIKLAGACAVVAVVIGAVLASASHASAPGSGSAGLLLAAPFPGSAGTAPSGGAGSLQAREITAMTRRGIAPARAGEAVDVEGKITQAGLVRKLLAAMGGAYAGVWFEHATAQLYVGVTSPGGRQTAARVVARAGLAANVTMTPVHSTWAEILAAQQRWDHRLAHLFARAEVETALAPQHNAVAITLGSSVPVGERDALEREAAAAGVNVLMTVARVPKLRITRDAETKCKLFLTLKAYCDKPITAGVRIESRNGWVCTAGPLTIPEVDKNRTYLLTAGHCIQAGRRGAKWFAYNTTQPGRLEIGTASEFLNGKLADVGAILVKNPGEWVEAGNPPVFAVTAEWKKAEEKSFPVQGERGPPTVGNLNCVEGQTSGGTCGKIKATGVTLLGTEGLVEDEGEATSAGSDSGGPVIVETKGGYLMEGTDVGHKISVDNAIYEPLETALKELKGLKLELLTTSNEVRPKESAKEKEESKKLEEKESKEKEEGAKEEKADEKEARAAILSTVEQKEWTGANVGEPVMESAKGTKVKCVKEKIEGYLAVKSTGEYKATFEECTEPALKVKCTGLGDKEGVILTSGIWQSVIDSEKPVLGAAIVFEPEEFQFTCFTVKVLVKGSVICLFVEPTASKTTHEFHCEGEKGKPKETEYFNGKSEKVKITPLELSINGGAFEGAAAIGSGTMTFKEAVEIMD